MNAPLPQTWWVDPGRLLAGGFPGDRNAEHAEKKLRVLLETGVRCFVSLQEPGEMSWAGYFEDYRPVAEHLALAMDLELAFHNFPIPDMGATDDRTMTQILNTIDGAIASDKCVYVHCWGGHGRTGMVVGCWLCVHGLSGSQALRRIQELRCHDEVLLSWESPQTPEQVEVILGWGC